MNAKIRSHSTVFGFVIVTVLGVLLPACTFPSTECSRDELVAPSILSPMDDAVLDDLTPTLTWRYDGDCEPDGFRIKLSSSHDSTAMIGEVERDVTWWTPPAALEPGLSYGWSIVAVSGSTQGPRTRSNFRTGPLCTSTDPADYSAPQLVVPTDGYPLLLDHIIFSDGTREPTLSFYLIWDDFTGCMPPEGYHIEVASSSDFGSDTIVEEWTTVHHRSRFSFPAGVEWVPCAEYFWRVTTILPDSSPGPTSETGSFITPNPSSSSCMELFTPPLEAGPLPTGTGVITGLVWHDECALPATVDDVPPGCIRMPDGGVEANGILDLEELGIGGVTVRLGSGPCPVVGGRTDLTDENGYYGFTDLPAGTYCVAIDAMDEDNIGILIPGNWTRPYRWYGPGPIEVEMTLGEGEVERYNDYGWDYMFLPMSSGAIPPTPLTAAPIQTINCRFGPGTLYDIVTTIRAGVGLPITGRNPESTWLAVQAPGLVAHCWVSDEVVEVQGDLEAAPVLAAPPLPSPTPNQGCWVYNAQQQLVCTAPCPTNPNPGGVCTP